MPPQGDWRDNLHFFPLGLPFLQDISVKILYAEQFIVAIGWYVVVGPNPLHFNANYGYLNEKFSLSTSHYRKNRFLYAHKFVNIIIRNNLNVRLH